MVPPAPTEEWFPPVGYAQSRVRRERIVLHVFLFLVTLFTTTIVGTGLAWSFAHNEPVDIERHLDVLLECWRNPAMLLAGLPFSLTLMTILLAHEMGHYLTCLRYGIDASPPYFLPAPTLIGTLGAFIRIRSPIYTLRALFDVGIGGPLAGFVLLVPALLIGLHLSHVHAGIGNHGDFIFGTPLLLRLMEALVFPGVSPADVSLHPMARAAWVGMLATALNLLPIGQLDGGHILYSFFGRQHKALSRVFVAALVPIGFRFYWGWLIWAVILALFGLRHPTIFDEGHLGSARVKLGLFALVMFLLCFTLAPIRAGS